MLQPAQAIQVLHSCRKDTIKFLLSELSTVRIVCKGKRGNDPCGYVSEVPLDHLDTFYNRMSSCPFCNTPFGVLPRAAGTLQDGFGPLAQAIKNLNAVKQQVEIEFVLPEKK
jgi:hypothetical protein